MANPEHVEVVKQGKEAIDLWRSQHPGEHLDLSDANLSGTDLFEADLSEADLSRASVAEAMLSQATLSKASLSEADVFFTDLSFANLTGSNLSRANLFKANLSLADLSMTNLSGAMLRLANFNGTKLTEADLSEAICGFTTFADCNLDQCLNLESVVHQGPSNIGIDTIIKSGRNIPRSFLLGAGVPNDMDALLPLVTGERKYYRCFISYTSLDEEFATRLHKDLEVIGVPCWKYDEDAVGGRKVWANIDRAIQDNDKVVAICSQNSLQRDGVPREIERALQKEDALKAENTRRRTEALQQEEKPDLLDEDVLVPVRLDSYVLNEWQHARKADVLATHVLDFSGWQDEAKYQEIFNRLLSALDPATWGSG